MLKDPRARLSLDIKEDVRVEMDRLKLATGAGSITEVIRRAIKIYREVVDWHAIKGEIIFRAANGKESKLLLP